MAKKASKVKKIRLNKINFAGILAISLMMAIFLAVNFQKVPAVSINPGNFSCSWKSATWGRGCAKKSESHFIGKSDDTKSDGMCVRAKRMRTDGKRVTISGSKSCGPISGWRTDAYTYNKTRNIRLYRDNGNYLTLWKR